MSDQKQVKKYEISLTRENDKMAVASAHGTALKISMDGMNPANGFTAPETLIAAYGACVMTNIGKAAKEASVKIDDIKITFTATKRDDPLGIENLRCTISVKSGESKQKLNELLEQAVSSGTATNAINEGLTAKFDFVLG